MNTCDINDQCKAYPVQTVDETWLDTASHKDLFRWVFTHAIFCFCINTVRMGLKNFTPRGGFVLEQSPAACSFTFLRLRILKDGWIGLVFQMTISIWTPIDGRKRYLLYSRKHLHFDLTYEKNLVLIKVTRLPSVLTVHYKSRKILVRPLGKPYLKTLFVFLRDQCSPQISQECATGTNVENGSCAKCNIIIQTIKFDIANYFLL